MESALLRSKPTGSTSSTAATMRSRRSGNGCARRASTSCRSCSTSCAATCPSWARGPASVRDAALPAASLRALSRTGRPHRTLAGHRPRPRQLRRSARHRRRLCPRLVALARSPLLFRTPAQVLGERRPRTATTGMAGTTPRAVSIRLQRRSTSNPSRVAVVGLGYWGPEPRAQPAGADPRPSVVGRVRLPTERSAATLAGTTQPRIPLRALDDAPRRPDGRGGCDRDPRLDASPRSARAALEAGKHVFVEKPLAAILDGRPGPDRARRAPGLVLMPGHTFLYSPPVERSAVIDLSGELGEIYFISTSRVNLGLHQADVERRVGSRPTRFLDPPLLARERRRRHVTRAQPRLHRAGHS